MSESYATWAERNPATYDESGIVRLGPTQPETLASLDLDALPSMARQVARAYLRSNPAAIWRSDEARAAWEAMQIAFVRYVAAYERAHPDQEGKLPDAWKGRFLPEHAAFVAASDRAARLQAEG